MQRNPWWYPPNYDVGEGPEAGPARPVEPARDALDGAQRAGRRHPRHRRAPRRSATARSHGCIRMHIPEAEWLFEHVDVGTPVVIL